VEVNEKSLEIKHFRASPYSKEAELTLPAPPGSLGDKRTKKSASAEAIGCTIIYVS